VPISSNPASTVGLAPVGVPSFTTSQFEIPPFLLPIYQRCGTQYGIPWEVLAGINRIETAFGTNLNVSTAGAVGWMQFIPSTWKTYGVDANGDGRKDPYNPVDAICAAGRYLKAAGGDTDLRRAIFAYNHADWYVDEVLLYAAQYGGNTEGVVGSLGELPDPLAPAQRLSRGFARRVSGLLAAQRDRGHDQAAVEDERLAADHGMPDHLGVVADDRQPRQGLQHCARGMDRQFTAFAQGDEPERVIDLRAGEQHTAQRGFAHGRAGGQLRCAQYL